MADLRCKYYKQKKQVSYDNGVTWADVIPYEYQKGELYETESQDCGYVPPVTEYRWVKTNDTTCVETPDPQYRWVNMDASVDYYCEGTTKYYKQKKQVSLDGGQTWSDVVPAEYQKGGVAQTESTDCGYVPPTPTMKKVVTNYSDGRVSEIECNSDGTLTSGETQPSGYDYKKMTSAVIGTCVTRIGEYDFYSCTSLTSVTIPNSVTSIGDNAFENCDGLTSVTIPNSVTTIGDYAFRWSDGLTSINIPDSVTTIGKKVFYSCDNLASVTIGNSIRTISESAFEECSSITSVTIPSSVTAIGDYAFASCSGLPNITIPNSVTSIGEYAFNYCSGLTSIVIPDSVTTISSHSFYNCRSLTSCTIGNSVTSIGYLAFGNCSGLTSINIPDSVTTIGNSAFQNCHGLTSCTIGSGVTYIDNYAFNLSGLTSVTCLATTPPRIGYYPFANSLIFVPCESVNAYKTSWSTYADKIQGIQPCNITKLQVSYSDGTTREVECNSSVALTSGETKPSGYDYSTMTNAVIGDCVTTISGSAFFMCYSLTSVTIPNTVTRINSHAFDSCSLTSVTIPSSVTRIDGYAFAYCGSLTSITCFATTPPTLGNYVFDETNNCPIYVPASSVDAYKAATNWSSYASRIQPIS